MDNHDDATGHDPLPELLPVPEHDYLTREQAERDDTVDLHEHDDVEGRWQPPARRRDA